MDSSTPLASPKGVRAGMAAEGGSKCPIMRFMRYVVAMGSSLMASSAPPRAWPAPPTTSPTAWGAMGRVGRCPFLRLVLVLALQLGTASAIRPLGSTAAASTRFVPPAAPTHGKGGGGRGGGGTVLVLGGGWVGSRLARHLIAAGDDVVVTSRDPGGWRDKKPYFRPVDPGAPLVQFELENEATWASLPDPASLRAAVVTFAVTDLPAALRFHDEYLRHARAGILCGSTSVYAVDRPNQVVTEATPIQPTSDRGLAEEALRGRGATLLALGGIFGGSSTVEDLSARSVCSCLGAWGPGCPTPATG